MPWTCRSGHRDQAAEDEGAPVQIPWAATRPLRPAAGRWALRLRAAEALPTWAWGDQHSSVRNGRAGPGAHGSGGDGSGDLEGVSLSFFFLEGVS